MDQFLNSIKESTLEKENRLRERLRALQTAVVAYSGGVDSSYLAFVAASELGERAVCVTGLSASVAGEHRERALRVARSNGLSHRFIHTDELEDPDYVRNDGRRCFYCKSELYGKLKSIASAAGIHAVLDGTNADDVSDYRPGREAASQNGVESPLADLGFTKEDIRMLSRHHGLETWDIPASPCLASRITYGLPVTIERLKKVELGEDYLRSLGFSELRVRSLGNIARLEFIPGELERAMYLHESGKLDLPFRNIGFQSVEIDPKGFRSGSLNEALKTAH